MRKLPRVLLIIAATLLTANAADLSLTNYTGAFSYGNTSIGTLTAGGSFTIPSGSSVEFYAANVIRLTPGFTATQGSYFNAKLVTPILNGIVISRVQNSPFYPGNIIDFDSQGYDQTGQPMSATVIWSIDSGGGSINVSTGVYTPSSQGDKVIRATSGSIYNTTSVFVESPTAPKANFTFSQVTYPLGYSFNASSSTVTSGRTIVQYTWNFGDGTAPITTSSPSTTHDFPGGNGYQVSLSVKDNLNEISAPKITVVSVTPSQSVYLTATPTVSGATTTWSAGYTLTSRNHSIGGVPSVTTSSVYVGEGWRMKRVGTTDRYVGFKSDRSRASQNIQMTALLLEELEDNLTADVFLMAYSQNGSGTFSVGSGWIEDMGTTDLRPTFIPNTVVHNDLTLMRVGWSWPSSGNHYPKIRSSGYAIGQPIQGGVALGRGWISGIWHNRDPIVNSKDFVGTVTGPPPYYSPQQVGSTFGTFQEDTTQDTTPAMQVNGIAPYPVWYSNWYKLSDTLTHLEYSITLPLTTSYTYQGKGYIFGSGMNTTFMPSGSQ
jgi:PKD domain